MKKLVALLLFASLFSAGISSAQTISNQPATTKRGQWIDKNNDGICDNYQNLKTNPKGPMFVDKNNNGICDNYQKSLTNSNCPNFVDKNKDGICDNLQNNANNNICCGRRLQYGKGKGYGWRNR